MACAVSSIVSRNLDQEPAVGDYRPSQVPEDPVLVHMLRTPSSRALPQETNSAPGIMSC